MIKFVKGEEDNKILMDGKIVNRSFGYLLIY